MKNNPFDVIEKYRKPAAASKPEPSPETAPMAANETDHDATDDPMLSVDQWYPEFHRVHYNVVREVSDFDYVELRQSHPDLYQRIKAKEAEIDALGPARLSTVINIMADWRGLILEGFWTQLKARKRHC